MDILLDFLRNPVWSPIGVGVAVVSLILAFKHRRSKQLVYHIRSKSEPVVVRPDVRDRIQILFDSKAVDAVHLTRLGIVNRGTVAIKQKDFEYPMEFTLANHPPILSAEVAETTPEGIVTNTEVINSTVRINIPLLNPGDDIELLLITAGPTGDILPGKTRIDEVPYVRHRGDAPVLAPLLMLGGIVNFFAGPIVAVVVGAGSPMLFWWVGLAMMFAGLFLEKGLIRGIRRSWLKRRSAA